MKQVVRHWSHAALWVLVMVVLASTLATLVGVASAGSPTYTLNGIVEQPGGITPVPAGVQVDLVSRATGAVFTTTVNGSGGAFQFTSGGTGGALQPGWWGIFVPVQTNVTLAGFSTPVAILPQSVAPVYYRFNASQLTTTLYAPPTLTDVTVVTYTATLTGNVSSSGGAVAGGRVSLLDPNYNTAVLVSNLTTTSGNFSMKVPLGSWVLRATEPGATTLYNLTTLTVASRTPPAQHLIIQNYLVTGRVKIASGAPVVGVGNVTLYNTVTHAIFTAATDTGFYSIGAYPGSFDVILATSGYTTTWYPLTVSGVGPYVQNVTVAAATSSQIGVYNTSVNLVGISATTGKGTISVTTNATLGNNSVFSSLGNASVRQLWGQLGLTWTGAPSFPDTDNATIRSWINSSGPFFPAVQAGLSLNGTGFLNPTTTPSLTSFSSACMTASCGLSTAGGLTFGWQSAYALNGTLARNSSAYTLAFGFRHPSTPSDVFNYTFTLPTDYVLAAGTSAPSQTTLVADGMDHTWTSFTLSSLVSTSPAGSASFSIVRAANLTANVNVSVSNFAFSSRNILNSTHNYYTAIVGVGENVTFSALNSTYPAGQNGTKFVWSFGDLTPTVTTRNTTTNHTYTAASGAYPYNGTLNVTSSSGISNETHFFIWVANGAVTAKITGNWSSSQYFASGPYVRFNWSTVLQLNATASVAKISPTAPINNVIAASVWTFKAKGFSPAATNLSASQRLNPLGNVTRQFLGAGTYYNNVTLNGTKVVFKGWVYNLTLTVWSGTGQSASTSLVFVVNDTEPPVSAFTLQNSAGKVISGGGIQVAQNGTAKVFLNATNATDPHNGTISRYYWLITNSANTSLHQGINTSVVRPNGFLPTLWLIPENASYKVNLTVWDGAGNHAYTVASLTVAVNSTYNVILAANNLTAPSTYTAGTSYTFWVNVSVGGGAKAVAANVSVSWYLLSPSGTGSRTYVGGTVQYYNYSSGVVNSTAFASGKIPSLKFNQTVRAQVTWTPSTTGNFLLYANATASNEYVGNYVAGTNLAQKSITVNPNPTTEALIYGGIAAAAIAVIVLIVLFLRRRSRRASAPPSRPGRGGDKKPKDDDEDEDDET